MKLGLEVPQCAQLYGKSLDEDHHHLARPRLILEGEDEKLEA